MILKALTRQRPVEALRFMLGTTTKQELVDFCGANVGTPVRDGVEDQLDIRWCVIETEAGPYGVESGDWIVKSDTGHVWVLDDEDFNALYELQELQD